MSNLVCRVCGKTPNISEYRTDGDGFCTKIAKIKCDCGVAVIKDARDYLGHGDTGWDIAESAWKQAMRDAESLWDLIMSMDGGAQQDHETRGGKAR